MTPHKKWITHLYNFFHVQRCLVTRLLFSRYNLSKPSWILFLLTIKIFKGVGNLLANVAFPYKTPILVRLNVCVTGGTRTLWRHYCKALLLPSRSRHCEHWGRGGNEVLNQLFVLQPASLQWNRIKPAVAEGRNQKPLVPQSWKSYRLAGMQEETRLENENYD